MIHMLLRRRVVGVWLAGMLLAAVLVPVGAGAQSDGDGDGVVSGVVVCSDVVGSFWVGWEAPVLVPSDFRVSWAVEGLGFLSWRDDDEVGRGNVYPGGGESSLMVEGLEPGAVVQVRLRARYFDDGGVRLWSGPWSELVSGVVAVEPVESDGCGHDDEESTGEIVEVSSRESTENIENIENIAEQSDENGEGSGEGTDEGVVAVGSVLAGVMSLGGGSSSGSTFAGYSSPPRDGDPPRVGGFEMSFIDGVVMRRAYQLFALAQIRGEVASGPAAGLSDPVALTMWTGVDLSGGFRVEAGDVWLSSVDAEVLGGVVNAAGYRYWLWDAPCVDWQSGDVFDFALVAGEGAADDPVFTDGLLRSVGFDGATLDSVFDPMETSHVATADADAVSVTVNVAAAAQACDVVVTPADADPVVEGHQVVLGEDGAIVGVTVTAADNATTVTHTLLVGRGGSVPAGASKMSLRGVGDIDFEPLKLRYDTIVPSGVTSTVVEATSAGDTVLERFTITAGDTEFTAVGDDGQVTLTAGRDTLVAVRAATPNNERQSVYTMRLRAPRTPSQPDRVPKSMGRTWGAGTVSDAARNVQRTTEPLLSGLTINSGNLHPVLSPLQPGFVPRGFSYVVSVPSYADQVTVKPLAAEGSLATIWPRDARPSTAGHQVVLNAPTAHVSAQTAIVVTVSNAQGEVEAYTITVTRRAPWPEARSVSQDASLASLGLSEGELSPGFDAAIDTYIVSLPVSTGWVTLEAVPNQEGASVEISVPDADAVLGGHQVALAASPDGVDDGATNIIVTVTAVDEVSERTYTVVVSRPPAHSFGTDAVRVINLRGRGVECPDGIWSDGRTLWVTSVLLPIFPGQVYGFDIATGRYVNTINPAEISWSGEGWRASRRAVVSDLWSDGESMWTLDRFGRVFRHDINNADPENFEIGSGVGIIDSVRHHNDNDINSYSKGIWSDGEIMWVANTGLEHNRPWSNDVRRTMARAFNLDTGERLRENDIVFATGRSFNDAEDIWSDGTTMWVVYRTNNTLRAYDLASGEARPDLDIDLRQWDSELWIPNGMWSDGGLLSIVGRFSPGQTNTVPNPMRVQTVPDPDIWRLNRLSCSGATVFKQFYLPTEAALDSLSIDGVVVESFSPWNTSYTATVAAETDSVTIAATAQHDDASALILPADADPDADGHQIDLVAGDNVITVTTGTYNHTMTYTLTLTR